MRKIAYICLFASFASAELTGCNPIEKRDMLTNSFNPNDIKLESYQATPGGNQITLKLATKGVAGYWDYNIGSKFSDVVSFVYPATGKATFTFRVTTPYLENNDINKQKYITKSIDVQVDKIVEKVHDRYYKLVGSELKSKTWIFDGSANDGRLWYYMAPDNDPQKWEQAWWNAGGTGSHPTDTDGKMSFDLNGGANFTRYATRGSDATPMKGRFMFNEDFSKLTIINEDILGGADQQSDGVYNIIMLTDDKLILYNPFVKLQKTGWVWVFRPLTN